jgi:hypothetical protein
MSEMEIRYDSAAKVQPVEFRYMATPGTCLGCNRIGVSEDEIFAYLQVELEFYGVVYLCTDCCRDIAAFVGFLPPDSYRTLQLKYAKLETQLEHEKAKTTYLKGILDVRIDAAGRGKLVSDDPARIPISKTQPATNIVDQVLNGDESKFDQSGKSN